MTKADNIVTWILGDTLQFSDAESLLCALMQKFDSEGCVRVSRASLDVHTVHPEVFVKNIIWKKDSGVNSKLLVHKQVGSKEYKGSPVADIYAGHDKIRLQLNTGKYRYPLLEKDLEKQGFTDYIVFSMDYTRAGRSYVSYCSQEKGGFTDEEIELLNDICIPLSRRLEIEFCHFSTHSLLEIYLGKSASLQVINGNFRRGSGEKIEAVIWLCDLRNYTKMTMSYEGDKLITNLNSFFELVADTIAKYGGEIIKFIGDSMLVIFNQEDKRLACQQSMNASLTILKHLKKVPDFKKNYIAIAIHYGSVIFGNVGGLDRLDFTIVGREVNYTSRLEAICKRLNISIILSSKFVQNSLLKNVRCLGEYDLAGFPQQEILYTIA